jgi:hypothetical protein
MPVVIAGLAPGIHVFKGVDGKSFEDTFPWIVIRIAAQSGGALSDSYKCIFSRVSRSKFRSVVAWS